MTINDLEIGDIVLFGAIRNKVTDSSLQDIEWIKVDNDNTLTARCVIRRMAMDEAEPRSSSRDRRERGCNFFPQSNLFQWLNSAGQSWFVPVDEADEEPVYSDMPGFLSDFDPWELDTIVPHEICVGVPNGYRRKFGSLFRVSCKVSIPAAGEVLCGVSDDYHVEGELFPYYKEGNFPHVGMWLRTATNSSMACVGGSGDVSAISPCRRGSVVPMLRIHPETRVSDRADKSGCYRVLRLNGKESCVDMHELYQLLSR